MRLIALLFAAALSFGAAAQDWPKQKPIHIVVGFAPASTTDLVARLVAERLAQLGLEWKTNTSGEFAAFLRGEIEKWGRAVRQSGAKAD